MTNPLNHLGLIPDGGRRWARKNRIPLDRTYCISLERLGEYCRKWFEGGINTISLYLLSKYNLRRSTDELQDLNTAGVFFFNEVVTPLVEEAQVDAKIVGRLDLMPPEMSFHSIELPTVEMPSRRLYMLVAYDPFDELLSTISQLENAECESDILEALWIPEKLDLLIRTGGAKTLSRFLPLQTSYAHIIFLEDLFNDLSFADLNEEVVRYLELSLRFGN